MWILLYKLFKVGFKEAKKHKAKKAAAADPTHHHHDPQFQPPYPSTFPPEASSSGGEPQSKKEKLKYYLDSALRTLQLALCLAIIGLYGGTLNTYRKDGSPPPAKWVYAVVAGFLGGITALVYLIVGAVKPAAVRGVRARARLGLFAWESVLCVLFLVLFGVFGGMFIGVYEHDHDQKGSGNGNGFPRGVDVTKMRRAVWVDLVTLVVFVGTAGWAGVRWWRGDRGEGLGDGKEEDLEMKG